MLLRRLLGFLVIWLVWGGTAVAQVPNVTEDATSIGTVVTPGPNKFTITGGTTSGETLFHSFDTFSPRAWSAVFDLNATDGHAGIERIFGRVTGADSSTINGGLEVIGGSRPDLFLFNPNGITLEGAYLSLPGSFSVSTATSVLFEGGWGFSAVDTEAPLPLLQVSAPVGLQYGQTPSFIDVRNIGLNVQSGQSLNLLGGDVSVKFAGLGAPNGSINLAGDSVSVESAGLDSSAGRIALSGNSVSVKFAGLNAIAGAVDISGETIALSDIGITTSTYSALDAGDIEINGTDVTLQNLTLTSESTASGSASNISVAASDSLLVESAGLFNHASGTASAGDINLSAENLIVRNNTNLNSSTAGGGKGGDITFSGATTLIEDVGFTSRTDGAAAAGNVQFVGSDRLTLRRTNFGADTNGSGAAGVVEFVGGQVVFENSHFGAASNGSGAAGTIGITADDLLLVDSGFGSNANASGEGGSINVAVTGRLEMQTTGFGADNHGTGQGGNISVVARDIVMNLSGFGASTHATGNAGVVTVDAENITLTASGIDSEATPDSTGNAGDINITTGTLVLNDSGIGTEAKGSGQGAGGQITINADEITLRELEDEVRRAELDSQSLGGGDSGGINITTGSLNIEGGIISIANFGEGAGGLLEIAAEDAIALSKGGSIFAANGTGATGAGNDVQISTSMLTLHSGSDITVATGGEGMGGSLFVFADTLQVMEGSEINASSLSEIGFTSEETYILAGETIDNLTLVTPTLPEGTEYGNAGDVVIRADDITVSGVNSEGVASKITSFSATNAAAGSIDIVAQNLLVDEGGDISVSGLDQGSAGNLFVRTENLELNNGASLQAQARSGNQGNLFLSASDFMLLRGGSIVSTDATEQANGGNITIQAPVIIGLENSDIVANAVTGDGGRISITTEGLFGLQFRDQQTGKSDITASSELGVDGTVEIEGFVTDPDSGLVALPDGLADASSEVAKGCATDSSSQFIASGRGGLPVSPVTMSNHAQPWSDIRDLSAFTTVEDVVLTDAVMPEDSVLEDLISEDAKVSTLIEADDWLADASGNIRLLSVAETEPEASPATCSALQASSEL